MNTVPVKVSKDRYILAIFGKDNLVEIVLRTYDDCPLTVKGYAEALRVAKTSNADGHLVHLTDAMSREDYDTRLAKYKARLALINSPII